ncbi:MAG TPA: hypothetical protein VM243_04185 [Phycisphaerae bacterium]|nr:hypothetical protein [Phycisphaerae bacterium]
MMHTRTRSLAAGGLVLAMTAGWGPSAQAQIPESQTTTQPADRPAEPVEVQGKSTTRPASPGAVTLSTAPYPAEVADEAEYARHVRQRTDALIEAAGRAGDTQGRIENLLAAANWILARQIEPQITRLLLGIEEPGDAEALTVSLTLGQEQLEAAGQLLADPDAQAEGAQPPADTDGGEDQPPPAAQRLEALHGDLSAFAGAVAVIAGVASGDDAMQRARRSASRLGVLLEDTRPGVAPAAVLYQALLFARIERMDRAMTVLDLALRPLPSGAEVPSFFGRLLRCRFLGRQGSHAVAWSLLLRLEERCQDWFDTPQTREEATASVGVVRLEVARAWKESLAQAGAADESAWCRAAEERIRDSLVQGDAAPRVMRLGDAVPILSELLAAQDAPGEATPD